MELKELQENVELKIQEMGFSLETFKLLNSKEGKTLQIVIDRVEPIDMNAIVEVTRKLNEYFDEIDPFKDPYTLDVSSLGAEKPLKIENIQDYVGRYIHVHLINPVEGENIYEGDLVEASDDKIKISFKVKTRIKTVEIIKNNISKIHLAIKF